MEYLNVYSLVDGDNIIPCPDKPILGVYFDKAVTIYWVYNDVIGLIATDVTEWEPHQPFVPTPTSKLLIHNGISAKEMSMRVQAYV